MNRLLMMKFHLPFLLVLLLTGMIVACGGAEEATEEPGQRPPQHRRLQPRRLRPRPRRKRLRLLRRHTRLGRLNRWAS